MKYMTGPGGKGHCTVFGCVEKASVEFTMRVAHDWNNPYFVVYPYCAEHRHIWPDMLHKYPNYSIDKETEL